MGLHDPFKHMKHKLWSKERSGVKLIIWLSTIKSWESTQFLHVQVVCNIPLESSQRELQLHFEPHCNGRSAHEIMGPQSCGNPSYGNFGIHIWESQDKMPFGHGPRGETQRIL
jgi:hypothetical protein